MGCMASTDNAYKDYLYDRPPMPAANKFKGTSTTAYVPAYAGDTGMHHYGGGQRTRKRNHRGYK